MVATVYADLMRVRWIIDPEGAVVATTSGREPFATVDIDLELARNATSTYPRCVSE